MMGMSLSVSFLPMAKVMGPRPSSDSPSPVVASSDAEESSPLSAAESVEESEEHADSANAATAVVTTAPVRAERKMDFVRSEEHTSELQSRFDLVCRLLLEQNTGTTFGQIAEIDEAA